MKLYAAPLDFRPIADEFKVPTDFAPELHEAAANATDRYADMRIDARSIPLVTIDPAGSKDLDQAVAIERRGDGFRVYYAIADVAAFSEPGDVIHRESLMRGQTIYLPDEPARLHPEELSEGSASLLADVDRPAVLWTFDLDSDGEIESVDLVRAMVHSVARLDYDGVQADLEAGQLHSSIELLPEVGELRAASSLRRKAINLRVPSVRVREGEGDEYELIIEPRHKVMDYNSEISLLTGMAAGQMMQAAGTGFLRTLRPAEESAERVFRSEAWALGYALDQDSDIGSFLHTVDADTPRGMAIMREAQKLLRGAGYVDLAKKEPEVHAGIGGYYSHVTAPLRRLVDRYATEVCLALSTGSEIPQWVSDDAPTVLKTMMRTNQLASTVDRACLNLTEATVLQPWVGHNFQAVIMQTNEEADTARVFILGPPVLAECSGQPAEATETMLSLIHANPQEREVLFAWPAD